jgi:DNA (cytosine-5)-methyltransferase 1|nr:MAG TPA: Cytosine specific methyltransferase [Caudoviricetes sp.]
MKHLGDITKIHGDQIEPVDCITFGSPCQGLSMAGKRLGFDDDRSVLFLDAARIIKEMRTATNGMYPTFAVWENVPGAFSSNGGEDFRAVLEELARVEQPDVSIPRPSGRGGRWSKAGAIAGNGWSLAWRQLDAQYWGVPQRRKRIALVVDFGGQRAPEILFERTSLSGNPDESIKAWEATPGSSQTSPYGRDRGGNSYTLKIRSGCAGGGKGALVQTEKSATLSTLQDQTLFQPVVYDARGNGDGRTCPTITGDHENRITDYTAIAIERKTFNEQSFSHYKESDKCSTLKAKAGNIGNGSECLIAEKAIRWIVRRLTPVECERLQGYPDGWTDIGEWTDTKGKKHKYADTPRYKALGNSIALPQWFWIAQKMKPYLSTNATLGSLFDGIGGFPLVWQKTYGNGTARWASEIEEFPIAVTKRRFGEERLPVVSTAHHAAQLATTLARSTRQRRKTSRSARHSCMS